MSRPMTHYQNNYTITERKNYQGERARLNKLPCFIITGIILCNNTFEQLFYILTNSNSTTLKVHHIKHNKSQHRLLCLHHPNREGARGNPAPLPINQACTIPKPCQYLPSAVRFCAIPSSFIRSPNILSLVLSSLFSTHHS